MADDMSIHYEHDPVMERKLDDLGDQIDNGFFRGINASTQGFAGLNTAILQQIGNLRYDMATQHHAVIGAAHAEGEKTRELIVQNAMQSLRDRAEAAERKNDLMEQANYILYKQGTYLPYPPFVPPVSGTTVG